MSALSIQPTYPIFTDIDGQPLEDGYIWIGQANLDPQGNPINVYWDAALTMPAGQPIRTLAGYPANSGTPARLYVNSDYSIRVMNKNGSTVYSAPTPTERYSDAVVTDVSYTPGVNSLLTATTMSGGLDQVSDKDTGASRVGYKQSGLNRIATTVESKLQEVDSIFDFMTEQQISDVRNAVQFDCSAIVETAISTLQSEDKASLYFPPGTYYFANPVEINFDAQDGFRIHGASLANYLFFNTTGGTRFTGAPGLESIFIMVLNDLTQAKGYSFECDHIFFISGTNGGTGPLTALKNKIGGAPARPFIVKNCGFLDFDKAIVSDLSSTGGLTTGICQVIIRENTFASCGFSLYGLGGLGSIMDLVFCDNISENGGSIYVSGLGGTFNISDNLLEGQVDAVVLNGGLCSGQIARNYFEANSGYLFEVTASNPYSSVTVEDNYILNSVAARVRFNNIIVRSTDNYFNNQIVLLADQLGGKSFINNSGSIYPLNFNSGIFTLDYNCVSRQTSQPPATLSGGAYVTGGGAPEVTPLGTSDVANVNGAGAWMTPAISLAANDAVVAMCLVRPFDLAASPYLAVYDNAYAPLNNTSPGFVIQQAAIGEWLFLMAWVKVPSSSGGNPRIRWVTTGGRLDFTETYFYKITAPTNNSTPIFYCLPNP